MNGLGELKITFQDWVNDIYEKPWSDIKQEMVHKGHSYEAIMEEYFSLRDHYKWEIKNYD